MRHRAKDHFVAVNLTATIAAGAVIGEVAIICLAGFALFQNMGNTLAEAAVYAVVTSMMILSGVIQIAFLFGIPAISLCAETFLVVLAVIIMFRLHESYRRAWKAIGRFFDRHPLAAYTLTIFWSWLAVKALIFAPLGGHWDSLGQVLLFERYGSFFPGMPEDPVYVLFPVNSIVLTHVLLRFDSRIGIGLFGFLAYLSIGFSTYALARRYAWPPMAITVTMVVVSMPRLVFQAVSPGAEIIPAAVSLFCILAVYRVIEEPNPRDLILLVLGLLFGISGQTLFLAFPVCLILLSAVLLFRRHGMTIWPMLIGRHRWLAFGALIPAAVFSQSWMFIYNNIVYGKWAVSPGLLSIPLNSDGLQGAAANLLRYLLECAHFTQPVEMLCLNVLNFSIIDVLESIYHVCLLPFTGSLGAAASFAIAWAPNQNAAWFGPFGFFLILPAVFYAMLRGPRRLRTIAVALAGYTFLVCLIPAWMPGNARFFTVVFTCAGFFVAFLLPPWRITRGGRRCIQLASALLLIYAGL